MNAAGWPEAVAAGINLIEVALGPEIAGEAFNIVMGMDTFESACRRADAKVKGRVDPDLKGLQSLLDEDVSLPATWAALQKERPTPEVTLEAIKQAMREGGAGALEEMSIRLKLRSCNHSALADLDCWLLKRGVSK